MIPDLRLAIIKDLIPLLYVEGLGLEEAPIHFETHPLPVQFINLL